MATAVVLGLSPTLVASADASSACASADPRHEPPGQVFDSIETAAIHALAHAHSHAMATPQDRGRYLTGAIQRVHGGYTYAAPLASSASVWDRAVLTLRMQLAPTDVASYVVHPASGERDVDRRNERPNRGLRRLVDELDARQRPLFVLTPSRRIKRYADHELVELTRLETDGTLPPPVIDLAQQPPAPIAPPRASAPPTRLGR